MYFEDSWGMVSLPASDVDAIVETLQDTIAQLASDGDAIWGTVHLAACDVQAIVETLQDAIAQLTSAVEHTAADAIADKLAVALDLALGNYD